MILELAEVGRGDVARVGGKGASLGEMLRAGIASPGGFVVEASVYRRAVVGIEARITAALAAPGVAEGETPACEAASDAIRALFAEVTLGELEAPLRARVEGMGPVAVRSSATAEDLPDASFAGQQETLLGVRGADEIGVAVRRCWASLWTARAISYRARQGYDHAEVALAVVVQKMVEPEVAGVLFTRDPVTGRADEMLLNASWGLGESVVSGRVTPDTWRLGRAGTLVREARIGAKQWRVVSRPEGGTLTEPVPDALRARLCLDESALRALLALGERVEAWYGAPQDIEFAWAGGAPALLQARPITTSVRPPRTLSKAQRRTLDDLLEHYPSPPLPLDEVAVVEGYETLQEMLREGGVGLPHAREILRMDADGGFRIDPPPLRLSRRIFGLLGTLRRAWTVDPESWAAAVAERRRSVHAADPAALDDAGLAAQLRAALDLAAAVARERFRGAVLHGFLRGTWLSALSRLARRPVDPFDWLGGLSYKTVQVEAGLQRVVDAVLDDAPAAFLAAPGRATLGPRARDALQAFLAEHGARTAKVYVPFSTRSWREDEGPLFAAIAAMVRAGERGAAERRAAAAGERMAATAAEVRGRLPRVLHASFDRSLAAYRRAHVAREATLYAIEEAFVAARAAADEAGQRLAARGVLGAPGHVVYARVEEVAAALGGDPGELRRLVGRRRARRELAVSTWRSQRPPPERRVGAALTGTAGSPGVATGPVRVVLDVADFARLQPGDVLVCPHTDPTWTPLFGLAAAVVADTGGPLSHAAIVAREYGIPAVLGTEIGTRTLSDGQVVVVDGMRGEVRVG